MALIEPAAGTRLDPAAAVALIEARPRLGIIAGLERTRSLLSALGEPQRGLTGVLVTGTNGKGSVCALIEAICRAHGLSTVMLTKPHLIEWRERIRRDGVPVSPERFASLTATAVEGERAMDLSHGPASRIELLTGMGLLEAAAAPTDVVICEVGIGGRLDSTNVLDLGVAVVTNIGTDHRALLGSGPVAIATEKAAIIKTGNHAITAAQGQGLAVIRAAATAANAPLTVVREQIRTVPDSATTVAVSGEGLAVAHVALPLAGDHQVSNLATAVAAAAAVLRRCGRDLDRDAVRRGVAGVRWPGRLQRVAGEPPLLLDAAHNPEAMAALAVAVPAMLANPPVTVFGALADKEIDLMLPWLRRLTSLPIMTTVESPRAVAAAELAARFGIGAQAVPSLDDALALAGSRRSGSDPVLVCGSLALIGDVLRRRA